jgi:phenylpyruvate tautomerase PptA (4-oxalocrotonate tautomerase family)
VTGNDEIREAVAEEITETVVEAVNETKSSGRLDEDGVWVIFDEVKREKWAYGGRLGEHRTPEEIVAERESGGED